MMVRLPDPPLSPLPLCGCACAVDCAVGAGAGRLFAHASSAAEVWLVVVISSIDGGVRDHHKPCAWLFSLLSIACSHSRACLRLCAIKCCCYTDMIHCLHTPPQSSISASAVVALSCREPS